MINKEWNDLFKHYYITRRECYHLLTLILIFAFILSFDQWGTEIFSFSQGILNFGSASIIIAISLFIHDAAHRIVALKRRLKPEISINYYWIFFSLLIAIISKGNIKLYFGEYFSIKILSAHRLGHFRYHESGDDLAAVAIAGPIASLLLGGFAYGLAQLLPNIPILGTLARFSFAFAIMSFLPLPTLDGLIYFFYSRLTYIFVFGMLLGYVLWSLSGIQIAGSIILSIITGCVAWWLFYTFWEAT
ncbi:MAG: hypothetical protein AABX52_04665 [Nanoarchaeota archaeon]